MFDSIKSFFKDYTIAHAVDNPRIKEESEQNKNLSLSSKLNKGIYVGANGFIQAFVIGTALSTLTTQFFDSTNNTRKLGSINAVLGVLIVPIVEEIIFRGILQNGIYCGQKFAKWAMPECIKNTRAFEWLTSSSARILSANSLFALVHLSNKGSYLSTADTVAQAGTILLLPKLSILHETTGNIAAPIVCHMMQNLLPFIVISSSKRLI